jgi:hypothetical protein
VSTDAPLSSRGILATVVAAAGGKASEGTTELPRGQGEPKVGLTWGGACGAGDGDRTRIASLEGWSSAIELHPQHRKLAHGTCSAL